MSETAYARDLALIGAGYWGKNLARNFNALGALHTLCDGSETTLAGFTDGYSAVRKTCSVEEIWGDAVATKVAISAPAALHYRLARSALLSGKDVFVEKPLCLEESEAQELVSLAESKGRILMVGHLLQYHPCVQKLRELVAQGLLGKLHYITSNRLNLGKIRREENALWSFAPHDLSVILSLVGDQLPEQVRCVGESYLTRGVADTTLTMLRFAGAVRSHVHVSWLNPFKEQKLTVVGSNGMAVFDDTQPWAGKLVLYRNHLTWTDGRTPTPAKAAGEHVEVPESEPLRNECRHFLECCRDRVPPRTDGREGLRVLQVLQMAQRSLEQDGEAVGPGGGGRRTEDGGQRTEVGPSSFVPSPASSDYFVHPTAVVDEGAEIGKGTKIWHFSHVMKGARIGDKCVLGQNVNVDSGTKIGNNVKIQNNVSIYTGLEIEDDAFLGPSCVLTNVTNPRSQINRHNLYAKTVIRRGATIGANATLVCGIAIGRYAFIAAGAVVTRDVPDYALMLGNPARQHGWMSRHGHRLHPGPDGVMICPETGYRYQPVPSASHSSEGDGRGGMDAVVISQPSTLNHQPTTSLRCLDLDEEAPLPPELTKGAKPYDAFKVAV